MCSVTGENLRKQALLKNVNFTKIYLTIAIVLRYYKKC